MESLRKHFTGVAAKYLSSVDATRASRQHEIGSKTFAEILQDPGMDKVYVQGNYLYLSDELDTPLRASGMLTLYNVRRKKPHRTPEYRLYYRDNAVTQKMTEGDFCVIASRPDGSLLLVITPPGTTTEQQIRWLFEIDQLDSEEFRSQSIRPQRMISLTEAAILEELGIEVRLDDDGWLDRINAKFRKGFPKTEEFSEFARKTCLDAPPAQDDPDSALMAWMRHEEMLFRTLERQIVEKQLAEGFRDVDHFVHFSLSVQNRRKSRVGYALEHHLKAVFDAYGLRYGWQAATEHRTKVDFLFPGQAEYHNPDWPADQLVMLASKSTCKDRWRQVLAEAARIHCKHLLTLEPAISTHQTDEMAGHRLQLVVPREIGLSYTAKQQEWLMDLGQYVQLVRKRTG